MSRLQEIRADFDDSFARAPSIRQVAHHDYLGIQVGASPYAIRMPDIKGLFADRPVTQLPSADSRFLGIAGLRGAIIPVYDLAPFLGHPRADARRWLILLSGGLALAFDTFDAYLNLPSTAVASARKQGSKTFIREALQLDGTLRPIIDVIAIFQTIEQGIVHRDVHEES